MSDTDAALHEMLTTVAHALPEMAARIRHATLHTPDPAEMVEYAAACAIVIDVLRRHAAEHHRTAVPPEVFGLLADLMIAALIASRSRERMPPAVGVDTPDLLDRFSAGEVRDWLREMCDD